MLVFAADYPFLDVLWTMLVFFGWVIWFWLLITVFADLFRRHDISGWGKAGWIVSCIFLPFLGVLIYLIAQGQHMAERNAEQAKAAQSRWTTTCADGGRRPDRGDREGQGPARQRRDHAGGVQRDQGQGARAGLEARRGRPMVGLMLLLAVAAGVIAGVVFDSILLAMAIGAGFLFLAGYASYKRLARQPPPPPPREEG